MARLFAALAGWQFDRAIETLRRGYIEAIAALDRELDKVQTDLLEYEESVRNGAEPVGEWDEDGFVLWDQARMLQLEVETLDGARMALRKAIVIQLYHLWERSARQFTKGRQDDSHAKLVGRLAAIQCGVHDRLVAVQHLVNTLKHGSGKSGNRLAEAWPEVVRSTVAFDDWYDRVTLSDGDVEAIAEISGGSRDCRRLPCHDQSETVRTLGITDRARLPKSGRLIGEWRSPRRGSGASRYPLDLVKRSNRGPDHPSQARKTPDVRPREDRSAPGASDRCAMIPNVSEIASDPTLRAV
jgi:hypothetical protein